MIIGGFMKNTFVDYPGKIASIVFTEGCNLNCWYCHNYALIENKQESKVIEEEIFNYLSSMRGLIDAVVVSGGEPTIQNGLIEFIQKIKDLGYLVKLDTNGTNPVMLEKLLELNLLDYVAMDIKAPLEKYSKICCRAVKTENITKSIEIIKKSNTDYEFRTTFAPDLTVEDINGISKLIAPCKNYYLQVFREENIKDICTLELHKPSEVLQAKCVAEKNLKNVKIRGL